MISAVVGVKLKSVLEVVTKEFGDEIKHVMSNNILEYQVEEYNRNFATKTLLHRVQPKNLKDFYQPLFITPLGKNNRRFRLEFARTPEKDRVSTHSIAELFNNRQFITLIGSAGSGKSTIVKYLFLNAIDTDFKIPIKVELRYLNDFQGNIIDFIKDRIFKLNRIAENDKIVERLMSSGDFVFFLDGYDEITSSKREKITKEIDDLVKLYNKNNYLLTSRPYTEVDLLPLFHNYEVCVLSDDDINQFIKKQIPADEDELCEKMIEAVNSQENYSYKSFLSNPLLLSMFILTFQSYSNIPQKRSEFYSQVFDALYSVHDSMSKLAFVREKQSGLSKEQFVEVLKLFSFLSYFDEKFIFSTDYINEKLAIIKDKKKSIVFDNVKLINDMQVAVGILSKEGIDFAFPHRSLQEYFAAIYISSLNEGNKAVVYKKVMDSLTNIHGVRSSKDNFHLLLSEIDEFGVIKHALIPYLEKFINSIDSHEIDYKVVIDSFVTIHSVYDTFGLILKSTETNDADQHFSRQFQMYRERKRKQFELASEKLTEKMEAAKEKKNNEEVRRELSLNDIKPFLDKFMPSVVRKKDALKDYLINESNIDSEIISLI